MTFTPAPGFNNHVNMSGVDFVDVLTEIHPGYEWYKFEHLECKIPTKEHFPEEL